MGHVSQRLKSACDSPRTGLVHLSRPHLVLEFEDWSNEGLKDGDVVDAMYEESGSRLQPSCVCECVHVYTYIYVCMHTQVLLLVSAL